MRLVTYLTASAAIVVVAAGGYIAAARGGWLWLTLDDQRARYATTESKFITVDGTELHVRDDNPNGSRTIMLLHGSFGNLRMWEDWVEALTPEYRVIRFDIPPNGLSGADPTGRYGFDRAVELTAALAEELKLQQFDLGGTSSGAVIAYRFAAKHPERVKKLIVTNFPVARVAESPPPAFRAIAWISDALLGGYQPDFYFQAMLCYLFHDDGKVSDDLVSQYTDMANRVGKLEQVKVFVRGMTTDVIGTPQEILPRITAPTLVLWSTDDPVLPLSSANAAVNALSSAKVTLATVPGGHIPTIESGSETARIAREFLTTAP